MDHLARRIGGEGAAEALYGDLDAGAYVVEWWPAALAESVEVARRHAGIGLVDASLVALAARIGTNSVAIFDERHVRALAPLTGEGAFRLLPADAG
jgi:predicted nucleic acid-binding protein